jgi:protein-S-isoprenylcysteine O-methyltransferase Ste14
MYKESIHLIYAWLVPGIWLVWWSFWLFSSRNVRSTSDREPPISRRIHLALVGVAFALIALPFFRWGFLGWHWLPSTPSVFFVGVAILIAGFVFAVWARIYLGSNWSGTISLKEEHELVRNGPYSLARHPIYTGFIMGMAGSAIALGEIRGILAVLLLIAAYLRKIRIEEKWLIAHFGQAYGNYRKAVRALIPFIL